jgi:hypothetical protein
MRIQRYSEWGPGVKGLVEFTASHSGCCGFYTKQNHILLDLTHPLNLILGQHSARQEEITVVFPCYRKVALQYMKGHYEIDETPVHNCHEVRLNRSEPGHSVTITKLGSIAPNLLSQLSPNRFDRPEVLSQRERISERIHENGW